MAIPRQVGVRIDSMKFRAFELSISLICLGLFIACLKISGWTEKGIIPYVWHEFGCEIAVFTIALAVTFAGMAVYERCRNRTMLEDGEKQLTFVPEIRGEKQQQRKRWLWSFLCVGSSPDSMDEPAAEAVRVEDFKTEKK